MPLAIVVPPVGVVVPPVTLLPLAIVVPPVAVVVLPVGRQRRRVWSDSPDEASIGTLSRGVDDTL